MHWTCSALRAWGEDTADRWLCDLLYRTVYTLLECSGSIALCDIDG